MNEHPILFSGDMVMAILEGRKTQTRRVIKPAMWPTVEEVFRVNGQRTFEVLDGLIVSLYGYPGDRLWVREAWAPQVLEDGRKYKQGDSVIYRADFCGEALDYPWRPSIHMPRWASRITLENVNVRAERVQDISEEEAIAEGVTELQGLTAGYLSADTVAEIGPRSYIRGFANLWNSINAKRGYGWDVNPWVWVITFKKSNEPPG